MFNHTLLSLIIIAFLSCGKTYDLPFKSKTFSHENGEKEPTNFFLEKDSIIIVNSRIGKGVYYGHWSSSSCFTLDFGTFNVSQSGVEYRDKRDVDVVRWSNKNQTKHGSSDQN